MSIQTGLNAPVYDLYKVYGPAPGVSIGYHSFKTEQLSFDVQLGHVSFSPKGDVLSYTRRATTGVLQRTIVSGFYSNYQVTRLTAGANLWAGKAENAVKLYFGIALGLAYVNYDVETVDSVETLSDDQDLIQGIISPRFGLSYRLSPTVKLTSELRYSEIVDFGESAPNVIVGAPDVSDGSFVSVDLGVVYSLK